MVLVNWLASGMIASKLYLNGFGISSSSEALLANEGSTISTFYLIAAAAP